ncbi:uncharacterized protein myripa [Stigmatopora nigra]
MGRKLDLSGLSNNEAEHVLQVVQRDMRLRKKEEERLSELKQALDEEGDRCLLLSRQRHFNQRCCIRCCAPFGFLLNPKRRCHDCLYNVCKACRLFSKADKAWLCYSCQKSRLVKKQSLDWFYTHVKGRFKRFGSAKVLKTIYRRHLSENSPVSELAEGSAYEDSVCESDSAFYTQTEEHSVAETLNVALRVAEEAIDEAITNAEFDASQENQNEVHYLREHRGELIEELAKTIMQKIIARRENSASTKDDYKQERSLQHNVHHHGVDSLQRLKGLWRSQSAFSLMDDNRDTRQTSPKDGGSSVSSWTSVERFENSGGLSSVLKSQDGNWIALQSAQLSRPSLLARRKSLVYSALERESGAVSAYEGMDSDNDNDNEVKPEPGGPWGAILQEFQRKLTSSRVRREADNRKDAQEKNPVEKPEVRRPSSYRSAIGDVNFNGKAPTEESVVVGSQVASGKTKRSRKKRRSKRRATLSGPLLMDYNRKDIYSQSPSDGDTPGTLTPDLLYQDVDISQGDNEVRSDMPSPVSENNSDSVGEAPRRSKNNGDPQEKETTSRDPEEDKTEVDLAEGRRQEDVVEEEEEVEMRLYKLVARSRMAYFSSTDDDLDRAGIGQEEETFDGERQDGDVEGLTDKLCRLEKEAQSTVLSSTEDELDRVTDEEEEEGQEEEELAVRVCRLADQAGAIQFSSTEDELDRDEANDEDLWRLREDEAEQVTRVRHLASLVSASQFSSTEDELDRVGKDEGGGQETSVGGERASQAFSDEKMEERDDDQEERDQPELEKKLDTTGKWGWEVEELVEDGSDSEEMDFDEIISGMLTMTLEDMREENAWGDENKDDEMEKKTESSGMDQDGENQNDVETEEERNYVEMRNMERIDKSNAEEIVNEDFEIGEERENEKSLLQNTEKERRDVTVRNVEGNEDTEKDQEWNQEVKMDKEMENEESGDFTMTNVERNEDIKTDQDVKEDRYRVEEKKVDLEVFEMEDNGTIDVRTESESTENNTMIVSEGTDEMDKNAETGDDNAKTRNEDVKRDDEESVDSNDANEDSQEVQKDIEKLYDTNEDRKGGLEELKEDKEEDLDEIAKADEGKEERQEPKEDREAQTIEPIEDSQNDVDRKEKMEQKDNSMTGQDGVDEDQLQKDPLKTPSPATARPRQTEAQHENEYSAGSLSSISNQVLKVLNATEELLQGVEGRHGGRHSASSSGSSFPANADPQKLHQRCSTLEEKVDVAVDSTYGVEAELGELDERGGGISGGTSHPEFSHLGERVTSAAERVQQSERQISDISARIAALKSAGLHVDPQSRLAKARTVPVMPLTSTSSRPSKRRLPTLPRPGKLDADKH